MALGALIGAYQEDDSGGLRALLPLAGRTLLEYQVRCAAAAGAAPIVVVVERVPQALQDAFERLRLDGIGVFPVSDVHEAVSRFEAGAMILLIGDGDRPAGRLVAQLAEEPEPAVATVPDDEAHEAFERIDAETRWAGVALVDAQDRWARPRRCSATGTCSRPCSAGPSRTARCGSASARRRRAPAGRAAPSSSTDSSAGWSPARASARRDWASRYRPAAGRGVRDRAADGDAVRPAWLVWAALALTLAAAVCLQPRLARRRAGAARSLDSARPRRRPPRDHAPAAAADAHARAGSLLWPAAGLALARARLVGGAPRSAAGARSWPRSLPPPSPKRPGSKALAVSRPATLAVVAPQRDLPGGPVRPVRRVDGLSRRPLRLCRESASSSSSTRGGSRPS